MQPMIPPKLAKSGWWLLLLLIPALLGLRFLIPRLQMLSTIQAVEQAGGRVRFRAAGPLWLRAMLPRMVLRGVQQVHAIELYGGTGFHKPPSIARLTRFEALAELDLSGCVLTAEDVQSIGRMTSLRRLELARTRFPDGSLTPLANLVNLESLNLSNSRVDDADMAHLASLMQLQSLHLDGTQVTGSGIRNLIGLASLKELSVSNTAVDPDSLDALTAANPTLTVFDD